MLEARLVTRWRPEVPLAKREMNELDRRSHTFPDFGRLGQNSVILAAW